MSLTGSAESGRSKAAEVCVGEVKCSREVSVVRCESSRGNMAVDLVGWLRGRRQSADDADPAFLLSRAEHFRLSR